MRPVLHPALRRAIERLARAQGAPLPAWPEALRTPETDGPPPDPFAHASSLDDLADAYQRALDPARRAAGGVFYTPAPLVEHLLEHAGVETPVASGAPGEGLPRVCDPACGSGRFLLSTARRIARARGTPLHRALRDCVFGVEIDPAAADLCRATLYVAGAPGLPAREGRGLWDALHAHVVVADALATDACDRLAASVGGFHAVVGNPPFLSRLSRVTTPDAKRAALLRTRTDGLLRRYADEAGGFLLLAATRWTVQPGGVVALVLPRSLLATGDAAGVRRAVAAAASPTHAWWGEGRELGDADVPACALVLRVGATPGRCTRSRAGTREGTRGESFVPVPAACIDGAEWRGAPTWAWLTHEALGGEGARDAHTSSSARADGDADARDAAPTPPRTAGVLADIASATADFRDQYYGLAGAVVEDAPLARDLPMLITSGLIDPNACAWGSRPARVHKRTWLSPRVDTGRLDEAMRRWAQARAVPKVLLATQTRALEAWVDERGEALPCVPVITLTARGGMIAARDGLAPAYDALALWRIAAVLLSPVCAAAASRAYAGAALSPGALKLSARQALELPLPADARAWDASAEVLRAAQEQAESDALEAGREASRDAAPSSGPSAWAQAFARASCAAYGLEGEAARALTAWWVDRLTPARRPLRPRGGDAPAPRRSRG